MAATGLLRPRPTNFPTGETNIADDKAHPTAPEMDYPAHFRNYSGFINLLKYGIIVTAIVTAVVLYTISN